MACCLPAWRSSQIRGSAEAVIGAHRVGYDTGTGTDNSTNIHSLRLLWQERFFKINASVIALMTAHGRLANSMHSAQYFSVQQASKKPANASFTASLTRAL